MLSRIDWPSLLFGAGVLCCLAGSAGLVLTLYL
jgi:hypothetical protein